MSEQKRKCVKCGATGSEDPKVLLYRFPMPGVTNAMKCELWAKYCFPDIKQWASPTFQRKLHSEHRMLCSRHFKWSSFIDIQTKKLHKHAAPEEESTMVNMDVKACRCCLSAVGKLERLSELMRKVFFNICGLKAEPNDGHPQFLCLECSALLRKALVTRRKARRAHFVLKQITVTKKVITKEDILKVSRNSIQLISSNGLWKPEKSSVFTFNEIPIDIPQTIDEILKPNSDIDGCATEVEVTGDGSKANSHKCIPKVLNNAAIIVDIKPDNYVELDRIEQESLLREHRRLEEEEALRQIREEDVVIDNDFVDNEVIDTNADTSTPQDIDLDDVFKGLIEPEEESDYSLSEHEELFERVKRKYNVKREPNEVKVKKKAPQVQPAVREYKYNGSLRRHVMCADVWAKSRKFLNVLSVAKIRHLSLDEQMSAFEKRKENVAYRAARFKCSMCVKPLVSRELLIEHLKTDHKYISDVKCAICRARFLDISDLEVHQAWDHWFEYTCICGQIYYTLMELVKCCEYKRENLKLEKSMLMQQHIIKMRYDKILIQPQKWSETETNHENVYACKLCGMEFEHTLAGRETLQSHVEMEKSRIPQIKPVKCECSVCGLVLRSVPAMEHHFTTCHAYLYKCKTCQLILNHFNALSHKHKTTPQKHFCVVCGVTRVSWYKLIKHQLSVHRIIVINSESMGDSQLLCCKTYFTNERAYNMHLLNEEHEAAKNIPLACVQCKILLNDEAEKEDHKHEDLLTEDPALKPASRLAQKRPKTNIQCEYCDTVCASPIKYGIHKSFVHKVGNICEICGKVVTNLNNHIERVHTSEDTREWHTCHLCPEKFKETYLLVMHIFRRHTTKPYVCTLCNHRTFDRFECKNHILKVHKPEKPFECNKCGARFVTWDVHDEHLKNDHKYIVTKQDWKLRKKINYNTLLCYPHMKLDGSAIPMDLIERCGLELIDYREDTKTAVPPEKFIDYFVFDDTVLNSNPVVGALSRKEIKFSIAKRRRVRKPKEELPETKKMSAIHPNLEKLDDEREVHNEIVVSYVRNEQGEFTVQLEKKEPKTDCDDAVPVPSKGVNNEESKAVPKYNDAAIQSPKAVKRRLTAKNTEQTDKRAKQSFVGRKTKPQTGKSLGIIDGFGDIVEGHTQYDAKTIIDKKKDQKHGFSETSVFDNPDGFFKQTNTSNYDTTPSVESRPNNNPSGTYNNPNEPNTYTSVLNNNPSGPYSNPSEPNTYTTVLNNNPSEPNNYTGGHKSEARDDGEETRLEIDAQELVENHEIVEIDGVQYVSMDGVLYIVEYS